MFNHTNIIAQAHWQTHFLRLPPPPSAHIPSDAHLSSERALRKIAAQPLSATVHCAASHLSESTTTDDVNDDDNTQLHSANVWRHLFGIHVVRVCAFFVCAHKPIVRHSALGAQTRTPPLQNYYTCRAVSRTCAVWMCTRRWSICGVRAPLLWRWRCADA